jgi:hypothetical protein
MVKVARKIPLKQEGRDDVANWLSRPPIERLRMVDTLRRMYIDGHIPPRQRKFSRVYRIVKLHES